MRLRFILKTLVAAGLAAIVLGATPYDGDAVHKSGAARQAIQSPLQVPALCFKDGGSCMSAAGASSRLCPTDINDVLVYHFEEYPPDGGGPAVAVNSGAGDPTDAGVGDSNYLLTKFGTEPGQILPGVSGLFGRGLQVGVAVLPYEGMGNVDGIGKPGADGYTLSFWLADSTPSNQSRGCGYRNLVSGGPFQLWDSEGNYFRLYFNGSLGSSNMQIVTGASLQAFTTPESGWYPGPMMRWQFYALVWDTSGTGTITFYRSNPGGTLDKIGEVTAVTATYGKPLSTSFIYLGRQPSGAQAICAEGGIYDEVRVANTARTRAQLESCYRQATQLGDYP